jgi:hypothetical protein
MNPTGRMGRLGWMVRRLRSMPAPEIAHRIGEQAKRAWSRRYVPDFDRMAAGQDTLPSWPGLRDGAAADAGLRRNWRELADAVRENRFHFLARDWSAADGLPDWHLDPETGGRWPADAYCFDIDYRLGGKGDIKPVWELNRLQYLQPLAALAALEDDRELAALVWDHVASWIAANPPFHGIAWASGIELAARAASLVIVAGWIGDRAPPEVAARLPACLAAHGYWIDRYPSRFSSANNHLIAEAGGLFVIGSLAPGIDGAAAWAAKGWAILQAEAQRQIFDDGIGAEQSPSYTAFSLEWLLLADILAARLGRPFGPDYRARLASGGRALRAFADAGGHLPAIGDDDEGCVIANGFVNEGYVNGILDALAAWLDAPDIAAPANAGHLRQAFAGTPPSAAATAPGIQRFDDGGYTVVRDSGAAGQERLLVFDHGPLGYLGIAAHGHADALAVWLHAAGRPVIVDAGTWLYAAGGSERDRFRGTTAHNTLSIAGADSSIVTGPFNWGARANCTVLAADDDPAHWSVSAEHDGYLARFGACHRRRVAAAGADIDIEDCLVGSPGPWDVRIGFLFAPDLEIDETAEGWQVTDAGGRRLLTLHVEGPLSAHLEEAWVSPAFGQRVRSRRLVIAGDLAPGAVVRTRLVF